ncbi:Regulator of nonsense transcripts 3A [Ilyonectria robusta]
MTQTEFVSILGSEWDVGKGRVDWFSYAPGKISNEYAAHSHAESLNSLTWTIKSIKAVSAWSRLSPCREKR